MFIIGNIYPTNIFSAFFSLINICSAHLHVTVYTERSDLRSRLKPDFMDTAIFLRANNLIPL